MKRSALFVLHDERLDHEVLIHPQRLGRYPGAPVFLVPVRAQGVGQSVSFHGEDGRCDRYPLLGHALSLPREKPLYCEQFRHYVQIIITMKNPQVNAIIPGILSRSAPVSDGADRAKAPADSPGRSCRDRCGLVPWREKVLDRVGGCAYLLQPFLPRGDGREPVAILQGGELFQSFIWFATARRNGIRMTRIQGKTDIPLNARGRRQAEALAEPPGGCSPGATSIRAT